MKHTDETYAAHERLRIAEGLIRSAAKTLADASPALRAALDNYEAELAAFRALVRE